MAIAFESLDSDIAGRTGKLVVNKKVVKTPALLPVINPHLQLVTPRELKEMGVEALITNAYIFSQSKQYSERVKEEGLHKLLDFDGVIMLSGSNTMQEPLHSIPTHSILLPGPLLSPAGTNSFPAPTLCSLSSLRPLPRQNPSPRERLPSGS